MASTPATISLYGVLVIVLATLVYRVRRLFLRGVPHLSAQGMGAYRIVLGAALFWAMAVELRLPDAAPPGGSEAEAELWVVWPWVEYLAGHWNVRDAVQVATLLAIGAFAVGFVARTAYMLVLVGFVVRLLVAQEYGIGSHEWVILPLVLIPLVLVPWGDAFSVDRLVRRRRDKPSRAGPAGPRYGIAIWLPGFVLGCAWAAAAAAKLRTSGLEWVTGGAVRYHWVEDQLSAPVSWGTWFAGQEELSVVLSGAGLVIEAFFITHVLFRSERIRAVYGLMALVLLSGFWVLQGVFWFAWWLVLLAFVPWERIVRLFVEAGRRRTSYGQLAGPAEWMLPSGRWAGSVAAICAVVVVQQVAVSRAQVEQMPFFSHYPMYSGTWESPEAFNAGIAPVKFFRYQVLQMTPAGDSVDITQKIEEAGGQSAILDAVLWQFRYPGEPLEPSTRQVLTEAGAAYEERFGVPLAEVRVVPRARIFDFDDGQIQPAPSPAPVMIDFASPGVSEAERGQRESRDRPTS